MSATVGRVATIGARLGEAPLWLPEERAWLWLDLQGRQVFRYDHRTASNRLLAEGFGEDLACVARWTDGAVLLASATAFHRLDLATGRAEPLPCPVPLPEGTIFNDGKVDRHGALWIGSSDRAETKPLGRLWRVAGGRAVEVARGFVVSNGPAFAPDGRSAYFSDSLGRRLLRFGLGEQGEVESQATFAELPEAMGLPDGMTVAEDGTLLVAHWDGARISRWSAAGDHLGDLPVPARNVTSLAFGGVGLGEALVTTAALFPGQVEGSAWDGDLLLARGLGTGLPEPRLGEGWAG